MVADGLVVVTIVNALVFAMIADGLDIVMITDSFTVVMNAGFSLAIKTMIYIGISGPVLLIWPLHTTPQLPFLVIWCIGDRY